MNGYIKANKMSIMLTGAMMAVTAVIYGLYRLPWGPAVYVILMEAVILAGVLAAGYPGYCNRLRQLRVVKNQAEYTMGELPRPAGETERRYQEILKEMYRRQKTLQDRLEESVRDSRQYYTRWSHQIKTPIAGIRLLLQEESPDRAALNRELYRIEQYVEMVLQYQRLGGRTDDLVLEACSLADIVKAAVKKTAVLFRHQDVSLELGDLEAEVVTDEKWLSFVIEQLAANAAKYTRKGKVWIGLDRGQPGTVLMVRDTGIGILPEDLPRIFEWGYTGYNGRKDRRATGIGLTLCRQTLERLGHSVRIDSLPGEGTSVYVDLTRRKISYD